MLTTLEKMSNFYKRNETEPDFALGSETLSEAFRTLYPSVQSIVVPLDNIGKECMPWHVNEPTVQSFDNPVQMDMLGQSFKISRYRDG